MESNDFKMSDLLKQREEAGKYINGEAEKEVKDDEERKLELEKSMKKLNDRLKQLESDMLAYILSGDYLRASNSLAAMNGTLEMLEMLENREINGY